MRSLHRRGSARRAACGAASFLGPEVNLYSLGARHVRRRKGVAMPTNVVEGGCFCGAIRYCVSGSPTNKMVCHCKSCRRVAGAPVVAWLTFPRTQFEFLRGQPAAFNSSDPVRRTFCPACGTPLTYEHVDDRASVD